MQFSDNFFDFLADGTKKQQTQRLEYILKLTEDIKIHSNKIFGKELRDEGFQNLTKAKFDMSKIYSIPKFEKNHIVVLDKHITFFGLLEEKIISFESIYAVLYESFYAYYTQVINPDGKMETFWSIEANEQIPGDFLRNFRVVIHLLLEHFNEENYFICVENLEKYYLSHLLTSIKLVNDIIMDYPNIICKEKDYRHILGIPNYEKRLQRISLEPENLNENLILFYMQSIRGVFHNYSVDYKSLYEVISNNIEMIKKGLTMDSLVSKEIGFEMFEFFSWYERNKIQPKFLNEKMELLKFNEQLNVITGDNFFIDTAELLNEVVEIEKIIKENDPEKLWWHEETLTKASFINFYKEKYKIDLIDIIFKEENHQKLVYKDLKKRLINLDTLLNERIFGQEHTFAPIINVIKRWFVGIKSQNKPIGSFMFAGNTGIGKTETAKVLADLLFDGKLITVDMSEYQSGIDVGKIIGVAPGYVGYEEGGGLLEKIKESPKCVLLFDEIEKAHPRIFDIFLQMLDEGRLTDNKGITVSFEETLIIFTTNHKAQEINELMFKFQSESRSDIIKILSADGGLRKEFLNRFTDIVHYRDLSYSTLLKIYDLKMEKIVNHLKDIKTEISYEESGYDKIREFILSDIDKSLGARELDRVINSDILDKIISLYVEEELKEDNQNRRDKEAVIKLTNKKLTFTLKAIEKKDQSNEQII